MAGDWIKMRVDLYRDPKIISMADILMDGDSSLSRYVSQHTQRDSNVTRNVMRNAVVGALVSVWGIARVQGKRIDDDLLMESVTPAVLDDIADMPGIGDAMLEARWVEESPDGLIFPRFFELYNEDYGDQRKRNRERQARYRAKKAAESNVTGDVTVTLRNAPREEKRREERREEGREEKRRGKNASACAEACSTPADAADEPAEQPIMEIPCTHSSPERRLWPVVPSKVSEWQEAYPAVDVFAELRKLLQWVRDNPTRKKTYTGVPKFVNSWLSRAQNDYRPGRAQSTGRRQFGDGIKAWLEEGDHD